ncbi:MAG: ATP-binding protein [Candidatus Aminicenantes bacterium]
MTAKKHCPECNDTGWVLKETKETTVAVPCTCFTERKKSILLEQAGIPKRYVNCSFDNFETHNDSHRHAKKISQKFVKDYPALNAGLLFIGPCGVGKTHLSVAIMNELIWEKAISCSFCDFRELIRNIQGSYSVDSPQTESDVLYPIFQKDLLVLDELGAKRTTAWVEEMVFYIINHRYNHRKLTIFTSNYLDSEEDEEDTRDAFFKKKDDTLVDRIGIRLRSRLYEMCKIVSIEGLDYRKKIKQASYRNI